MDPYFQCVYNRDNQERSVCMYENDGFSILNAQLDMMTSMLEQKRNDNAFNSNHVICDLCGGYHATYEYMQIQNMDYYDEFGHYNSCFDQCNPSWGSYYDYGWNNQCVYSESSNYYDYQLECAQYESKSFWELANAPWKQTTKRLANESRLTWEAAIER